MASDRYLYDSDLQLLPCDAFFPFSDSNYSATIDNFFLQQTSTDQNLSSDNLNLLSSSPHRHHLEDPTLHHAIPTDFPRGFQDSTCPALDPQESINPLPPSFGSHSYSGSENDNVVKYMQRSYSINSFEEKPAPLFNPQLDAAFMDSLSPDFQSQALNSPENCFFSGQIRRVCSTGDLQGSKSSFPVVAAEGTFMDEANLKVGRYSAEERKERILKYRAKRNQRNFNKTIKYACRKTLADNRPRIRGRFARNDEIGDVPKAGPGSTSNRDIDDDDEFLWGLQEEEEYGPGAGPFGSKNYGIRINYY